MFCRRGCWPLPQALFQKPNPGNFRTKKETTISVYINRNIHTNTHTQTL